MWVLQRNIALLTETTDKIVQDEWFLFFSLCKILTSYTHYCELKAIDDINSLERNGKNLRDR